MQHPNFFILYVNDPLASAAFYAQLLGRPAIETPTQMDFGYTFVATDPDAHRLRVFAANKE